MGSLGLFGFGAPYPGRKGSGSSAAAHAGNSKHPNAHTGNTQYWKQTHHAKNTKEKEAKGF